LGLYWDDAYRFMQAAQAANGSALQFILSDAGGNFDRERPMSYVPFAIARAAFVVSLPTLHWTLLALLLADAIAVASLARRIVDEEWFAFAAGATFLLYPLSPLQAIWPATVHYLASLLLTFMVVRLALRGFTPEEPHPLRYFVLAAVLLLAGVLTHEELALIAPVLVVGIVVARFKARAATTDGWRILIRDWRLGTCLASFFAAGIVYAVWRLEVLPTYGRTVYEIELGGSGAMIGRVLTAAGKALMPWTAALRALIENPPGLIDTLYALAAFVCAWAATFSVLRRCTHDARPQPEGHAEPRSEQRWLWATIVSFAVFIAGIAPLALTRGQFGGVETFLSLMSRVNFPATIGLAMLLPATVGWLGRAHVRLWRSIVRSPLGTLGGLVLMTLLTIVAFIRFPGKGTLLSHQSIETEVFGRYSVSYMILLMAYGTTFVFSALITLLSFMTVFCGRRRLPITSSILPTYIFSTIVSIFVFIAILYHFSIQQKFVDEWRTAKVMLEQLHRIAPKLADRTFVIIADSRPDHSLNSPYSEHWELSSYMLALYDNWSIMANAPRHIRFHRDGLDSLEYGAIGRWFPPGVRGPVESHARMRVPTISYDRVLMFTFDGRTLRLLPQMKVRTDDGKRLVIHSHSERILPQEATRTAVWRHVTRGLQ